MNAYTVDDVSFEAISEALGSQMRGFNVVAPYEGAHVQKLIEAWHCGLVCRIRNQFPNKKEFIRFGEIFGLPERALNQEKKLTSSTEYPELMIVSNIKKNGLAIGHLGAKEAYWHTDMCYTDVPPIASILYAVEIPESGGNTEFMNMYSVYDAIPADLKEKISTLSIKHDRSYTAVGDLRYGFNDVTDVATCPGSIHPIIQQHPVTGKNFLYLGRRLNAYVVGYSVADSEALLNELWKYTQAPEFSWTQHWAVGDILIWDNRCTMHRRDSFDESTRRVMWRTQIQLNPECRR
ncbi:MULTISPECIES: TauD/TfdA dioxygenase family protein [Bacteria]|uniref:TauD/TfdA dioxygenase family protein n=1 Tax=Bacteria TaxID=2 RepID=UPI0039E6294F